MKRPRCDLAAVGVRLWQHFHAPDFPSIANDGGGVYGGNMNQGAAGRSSDSREVERQPGGRKTPGLVGDLGPGRPRTFDPGPRILDPDIGLRGSRYEADAQSPGT